MAFYNRWRQVRENRGISMTDACRALGITKARLSQIESWPEGQDGTTLRVIQAACRLYSCQMSELYLYLPADSEEREEQRGRSGCGEPATATL